MKLFVSGTDTQVGKTLVSCLALQALQREGLAAVGMKPVAAGMSPDGTWDDVEQLRKASSVTAPLEDVAPYRLHAAASPHFAAREQSVVVRLELVLSALERLERLAAWVVIEGVGGFRVPLSEQLDSASLAQAIGAPVLLVVRMRLGCINHALLSAEAIARRGLPLAGWVANAGIDSDYGRVPQTVETLCHSLDAPCLAVLPYVAPALRDSVTLDIGRLMQRLH